MNELFDLHHRKALVTGSSRGLGAATAVMLASHGVEVVVTFRNDEQGARAVADQVRSFGRDALVVQVDLGEEASVDTLMDQVEDSWGALDIVVANAAATTFRPLYKAERRHLERTYAISVYGFHQLVTRALPMMLNAGRGRIVAVSGADTGTWIPGHGLLAGAKAAMESMVRYLGCELGSKNITTVGISPGWIDGDSIQQMLGPLHEFAMDLERETHPMRLAATPEQVAQAVVMLCTDAAALVNGNTIVADGAGVFAFCGRYSKVASQLAAAKIESLIGVDAPALPE